MMKKHRLSCLDFIDSGLPNNGCCDSCHDDWENFNTEMCLLEPRGRSDVEAHVCCNISRAINDTDASLREVFAAALRAHRERMR
jgi:hypothetical protein